MAESVITNTAKRKIIRARAGLGTLPKAVAMAFGDGAKNGTEVRVPLPTDTALQHELHRQDIGEVKLAEDELSAKYTTELERETLAGESINELALLDEDGDPIAIKSFSDKGKDDDMEMVFEITDKF
jgi:phage-related tail fiber protein